MPKPASKNQIADFWYANYMSKNMCGLCAQSGLLDTRGIKTPAGFECGGVFFCVCPNGQVIKRKSRMTALDCLLWYQKNWPMFQPSEQRETKP